MRVLNIIQRYYPAKGGAELFVQILSEYQVKDLGYKVDVWTTNANNPSELWDLGEGEIKEGQEVINGVNVTRFRIGSGILRNKLLNKLFRVVFQNINNFKLANLATCPTVFDMLKKIKDLKEEDYDVVTVSSTPYYFLFYVGYLISKKLNIPYIVIPALHVGVGKDDKLRKKYLKKTVVKFFEHAKKIILNTKTEGKEIEDYCKENNCVLDTNRFVVVGQGVFLNKIIGGDGDRFKSKYNLKHPIVFQIGSKNSDKGSYNLINAMKKLWDKGIKCHLVFGGARSDEFTDYIMKLEPNYKNYILNVDNISETEKLDLYDAGDIFSMVSKTDSFGIVYLEAWSYKKPVLACDSYAMKEIISNEEDGYLLRFEDTDSIALRIEELLKDREKAIKFGENGYKKVVKKYNWDTNIKILGDVYKDITG